MSTFFRRAIPHAIAMVAGTAMLTAIPLAIYFVSAVFTDDIGGFLTPIVLPVVCFAFAAAFICLFIAPLAILLKYLAQRWRWLFWLSPLTVPVLSCLVLVPTFFLKGNLHSHTDEIVLALICAAFLTAGFITYWITLLLAELTGKFLFAMIKETEGANLNVSLLRRTALIRANLENLQTGRAKKYKATFSIVVKP